VLAHRNAPSLMVGTAHPTWLPGSVRFHPHHHPLHQGRGDLCVFSIPKIGDKGVDQPNKKSPLECSFGPFLSSLVL